MCVEQKMMFLCETLPFNLTGCKKKLGFFKGDGYMGLRSKIVDFVRLNMNILDNANQAA